MSNFVRGFPSLTFACCLVLFGCALLNAADLTRRTPPAASTEFRRALDSDPALVTSAESEASALTLSDFDLGAAALCAKTIIGDNPSEHWGVQVVSGRFNTDSFDDYIISAPDLDLPLGVRNDAGAIAVIYGSSGFVGDTIDLETTPPNVLIYGAYPGELAGEALAIGDVNNDGKPDLVIGAPGGYASDDTQLNSGRVYIIFGAAGFPPIIDLRLSPDVVIYGTGAGIGAAPDQAGSSLALGDVNGDSILDILIAVPGADGVADGRLDAGEYHVIYGRAPWPSSLELETDSDVRIIGADPGDGTYVVEGTHDRLLNSCGIGDITGDSTADLIMSFPGGNGFNNSRSEAGETRILFNGSLGAVVDLATQTDVVLLGADAGDVLGGVTIADLDE
ncbi:MAG TPA: hypothetical protein VLB27_04520, partial [candidate division Zixibacteria bacterium]|nr:hypothetical protein [candidate division Zixibacteria bacterium]